MEKAHPFPYGGCPKQKNKTQNNEGYHWLRFITFIHLSNNIFFRVGVLTNEFGKQTFTITEPWKYAKDQSGAMSKVPTTHLQRIQLPWLNILNHRDVWHFTFYP